MSDEVQKLQTEAAKAYAEHQEGVASGDYAYTIQSQRNNAQATAKQNEERAVRAYQKMKGDEKLRERLRKALQIALALLEDGAVDTGSASEAEKKSA